MNVQTKYSDYWIAGVPDLENIKSDDGVLDLIKLNSFRKTIKNFTSILTNKNVKVNYWSGKENATDGTEIFLSADVLSSGKIDTTVGLSLHESAHILLSDFDFLQILWGKIPQYIYDVAPNFLTKPDILKIVKLMFNFVEDRYIDDFVYKNSPGYKGYYLALYDEFFNSDETTEMLKSNLYRIPTVPSYEHRIINITNKNSDLSALPDLDKIYKLIDLNNIGRLKESINRFDLACEIVSIVFKNVCQYEDDQKKQAKKQSSEESQSGDSGSNESENVGGEPDKKDLDDVIGSSGNAAKNLMDDISEEIVSEYEDGLYSDSLNGSDQNISQSQNKKIKKVIKKQRDFLAGNVKKVKLTKEKLSILDVIEDAKIDVITVGQDLIKKDKIPGIECILVKKVTDNLLKSREIFPLTAEYPIYESDVSVGISLGKKLSTFLKIRQENTKSSYKRKSFGKLDKRILFESMLGNENLFFIDVIDKFEKTHIHISVDASSSMSGKKWQETIKLLACVSKALCFIENIHLVITLRATIAKSGNNYPYLVYLYDSKKEKFERLAKILPYIAPNGYTPEGLLFEAILNEKEPTYNDKLFINISDGMPQMHGSKLNEYNIDYSQSGVPYTKEQYKKIKSMGFVGISYFINSHDIEKEYKPHVKQCFIEMYGSDAKFIETNNIFQIQKTINESLLKKPIDIC